MPALKYDMVTLETAGEVVPRRGNKRIFALQVLNYLIRGDLRKKMVSFYNYHKLSQ